MLNATLYGFIAGSALFIGAVAAVLLRDIPDRHKPTVEKVNKSIMAFGAGVLLCTLAYDLMLDAYNKGGFDHVTVGFLSGALLFVLGDLWLDRRGSGVEFLLGALLDGIPESAVIGIGLVAGQGLGVLMMVAVFLSNLPEGLSGAADMMDPTIGTAEQYSPRKSLVLWASLTLVCTASSLAGYAIFGHSPQSTIAFMLALAAGAILTMVAHTMIPEAFTSVKASRKHEDGSKRGHRRLMDKVEALAVVAGFLLTFILSHLAK